MKRKHLLKSMLLLCALIAGSSVAWAADLVETLTVKGWGSYTTNSYGTVGTDYTGTGSISGATFAMQVFNGSTGVPRGNQSGSSNFSCRNTTTYTGYYIKQVKIIRGSGSGTFDGSTSGRSVVYFGTAAYANPNTTAPTGSSTASEENNSGQSTLTWKNSDKSKTYFILYNLKTSGTCSDATVEITWASTSSDPSIDADDVTIECDATSGQIAYTINNPNGSTLTASEKSPGYDWIDDVTVDSENSKVTFTTTANTGAERIGYVTLNYGTITKDVKITQEVYVAKYDINMNAMINGSVASDVSTAAAGETVTLTITPASGYKLATISVTDESDNDVALSGEGNTRTFTMPASSATVEATFVKDFSVTYDFAFESMGTKDNNDKDWGGSYAEHEHDFPGAIVTFKSASKQTGTITDVPVTKDNDVIVAMTDAAATLKSASFVLKHWNNKVVTITMYYSKDGGTSWTTTGQSHSFASTPTYETVTLTASSLPTGTNAVKLLAGTEQQYGIASATVEIVSPAKITTAEYATYCNAKNALDFSETGITVYTATDNEKSVTLNEVTSGKIPANTPVVLYMAGADGTPINVPVIASADAPAGTNDLYVSDGTAGSNRYVLAKKTKGVGFYPWTGGALSAGKIYLQAKASYGGAAEFLPFDVDGNNDQTTGISAIEHSTLTIEHSEVYNLNGQRVSQPTKGLYIVNGKKFIVK